MMETFRAYSYLDTYGRLNIVPSTQIAFHVRRIISTALGIPKSKVRVIKPRIGGGFGAKQTVEAEPYPAIVTWLTGKPAMIVYTREEATTCGCPRHEMEIRIRMGANRDGHIRAISMYTLSNGGAYGEHSTTTVGSQGIKQFPFTANWRPIPSGPTWSTPICSRRAPTGASGPPRASTRWSRRWTSWPTSWGWTRQLSGSRIWSGRAR